VPSQAEIDLIVNATNTLSQLQRDIRRIVDIAEATAPPIRIDVEVDKNKALPALKSSLTSVLGGLGSLAKGVAGAGAAAGTAAPLLAGVVGAIQNILPAAAVATSAILAMQLATQTLKLGFMGVGDAITEAFKPDPDMDKVNEALKNLAPNARATVKEIISMKDEFKKLQLGVQNRLFKDFDDAVKALSTTALPLVRSALNDTAVSLNKMGIGVAQAAVQLSNNGTLGQALKGATEGIKNLRDVPGQAVTAFTQLAAAAAPAFDRITTAVGKVADSVSERLTNAFKSGALEGAINDAVDAIAQLGRVGANIFGALGNIIKAVSIDGQGLFGTIEQLTQGFQDITATATFQSALAGLSETMALLYKTVGPLLATAFEVLGKVLIELTAPAQQLITVLGSALTDIFDALGPVLVQLATTFGQLVVAMLPLVTLAGELIAGILPVLTPLFKALGDTFVAMTPFINEIATILGSILTPILAALPAILEAVLVPFVQLAQELFPVLTDQLVKMAPDFAALGVAIGELLVALAPIILQFAEFIALIDAKVIPIITGALIGTLALLAKGLTVLANVFSGVVIPIIQIFIDLLQGDFRSGNAAAIENVRNLSVRVVSAFDALKNGVVTALAGYVNSLRERVNEGKAQFLLGVQTMVNRAVVYLAGLPARAAGALGGIGHTLYGAGQALIQGLISGVQSKISELVSTLSSITKLIPKVKGPEDVDRKLLTPAGELVMEGFIKGIRNVLPEVRAEFQGITGSLPGFAAPVSQVSAPGVAPVVAPTILVTIGNEAVDQYVTTRVNAENARNMRTAAQGVRL